MGRVRIPEKHTAGGVQWGLREVLPLVETRVPFTLSLMELDSVARGAKDPDLDAVCNAGEKAALFEEKAIYDGFKQAAIEGILSSSPHTPLQLTKKAEDYPVVVERAMVAIEKKGIGGPYDLVLGTVPFEILMAGDQRGYPIKMRIADLIRGEIRWSPALKGGVVISKRGGDYELTVGQDFSVGYHGHDGEKVHLYITESFVFRVLEPRAALPLIVRA